jgi:catechol 2,3-dioxygenase-like lactoylglutathione lyase family enzyme
MLAATPWRTPGCSVNRGRTDSAPYGLARGHRRTLQPTCRWTLEVVSVPVADLDSARAFYAEQLGFAVDHDTRVSDDQGIIQLTLPGSGCSIVLSKGYIDLAPGSLRGGVLVVNDVRAARAELLRRGVDVGDVVIAGPDGFRPSTEDDVQLDNVGFLLLTDPDGNEWGVQQISSRP